MDVPRLGGVEATTVEVAVFASGVTSTGLEILAGRMIGTPVRERTYTWGSIIGVFLAALSYGTTVVGRRHRDTLPRQGWHTSSS